MILRPTRSADRPIPTVLQSILEATARRVDLLRRAVSEPALRDKAKAYPRRSLVAALQSNTPAVIAEIKKASPSKGVFRPDFDPVRLAKQYQEGGATALSVVTEPEFFQGSLDWIDMVRNETRVPVLRKDFIIDPIRVAESAAAGADAILLIARILTVSQLETLAGAAAAWNLEVLYEAHDTEDLARIADLRPRLVGINSRNLDDFSIAMDAFETLRPRIPKSATAIAESGLESHSQVRELMTFGYKGFLIGEALIRAEDPVRMLCELRGGK